MLGHSPGANQFFLGKQLIPGCDGLSSVPQFPYLSGGVAQETLAMQGCCKGIGATCNGMQLTLGGASLSHQHV